MGKKNVIEVLSPRGIPRIPQAELRRRPDTLDGRTLGILENNKEFSDWVLDRVRDRMKERFRIKEIVQLRKHHLAQAADKGLVDELVSKCDAVLVGVGH